MSDNIKPGKGGKYDNIMASLMNGMESFVSSKTVVGEPSVIGDTIIIPLVDVSFGIGVGAGSSDKSETGVGGIGGKITPNAVLVISNGSTRVINVKNTDSVTKVMDMIPDLVAKFTVPKDPNAEMTTEKAVETAFPAEEKKD